MGCLVLQVDLQYLCKLRQGLISIPWLEIFNVIDIISFPSFHSENVGLLALTRVGSRRVVQISAGFMVFFSVLGKYFISWQMYDY